MIPVTICDTSPTFPSRHLAGDTWSGMTVGPLFTDVEDGNAYAPISIVKMQFKDREGNLHYTLDSRTGSKYGQPEGFYEFDPVDGSQIVRQDDGGNITILDAIDWEIGIDSQLLELEAGWYKWDIEVVDTLGIARTIMKGKLRVVGDTTNNILAKENYIEE